MKQGPYNYSFKLFECMVQTFIIQRTLFFPLFFVKRLLKVGKTKIRSITEAQRHTCNHTKQLAQHQLCSINYFWLFFFRTGSLSSVYIEVQIKSCGTDILTYIHVLNIKSYLSSCKLPYFLWISFIESSSIRNFFYFKYFLVGGVILVC